MLLISLWTKHIVTYCSVEDKFECSRVSTPLPRSTSPTVIQHSVNLCHGLTTLPQRGPNLSYFNLKFYFETGFHYAALAVLGLYVDQAGLELTELCLPLLGVKV